MSRRPFTESEKQFIIKYYSRMGNAQIAAALGRGIDSIQRFASMNGLRKAEGFFAPRDTRALAREYAVEYDGRVVFIGGCRSTAEYLGVTRQMVRAATRDGFRVHRTFRVRYKNPDDVVSDRNKDTSHLNEVHTDVMDWPLWFFKAGKAPKYAKYCGKRLLIG